jgi:hypothetical protein
MVDDYRTATKTVSNGKIKRGEESEATRQRLMVISSPRGLLLAGLIFFLAQIINFFR